MVHFSAFGKGTDSLCTFFSDSEESKHRGAGNVLINTLTPAVVCMWIHLTNTYDAAAEGRRENERQEGTS